MPSFPPIPQSAFRIPQCLALALVLLIGCNNSQSTPSPNSNKAPVGMALPDSEKDLIKPRAKLATTDIRATQGHLPLRYLVGIACTIRVNDVTTNQQFIRKNVTRSTIVIVDEVGIRLNDLINFHGPLDKSHTYELILERQ